MCRPTESFELRRDEQFTYHVPDIEKDLDEMADVIAKGYKDGIDYLMAPESSETDNIQEARDDLRFFLEGYAVTGTLHHSILIREKSTNKLVALCVAGIHPNEDRPRFAFIADITVLTEFRGKGLAKFMVQNALTNASKTCDVMMLCVTVGNNAEGLYRWLGFWGGPRFTNMTKL